MDLGTLWVSFGARFDDLEKSVSVVQRTFDGIEASTRQVESTMNAFANRAGSAFEGMTSSTREVGTAVQALEKDVMSLASNATKPGDAFEEMWGEAAPAFDKMSGGLDEIEQGLKDVDAAADGVDAGRKLEEVGNKAEEAGKKIKSISVGESFEKIGQGLTSIGTAISLGVSAPLAAFGALSAKAAIDFETAFTGVRKTVNATEAELAALEDGFRSMALEIPTSATELARIGEAAGQLGIATEDILEFTEVMAGLGEATNLSSDEAATALARFRNITQETSTSFEQLGSVIVSLGNNFATTEREIVEMGMRIAGAGNQIGLTEAQILAFAASLSSVGIEAEAGGTAISRVFVEIQKSVQSGGKELATFSQVAGMTAAQFKTAFQQDAAGAIQAFISGLGTMLETGQNVNVVLETLGLENVRVRDALLRSASAGDLLTKALLNANEAHREGNALAEETARKYASSQAQIDKFKNTVNELMIQVGGAIVKTFMPALEQARVAIIELIGWFEKLAPSTKNLIVILGTMGAAVGPAVLGLGLFSSAIGNIITGVGSVKIGLAGLGTALGGVGGAGALVATAFGVTLVGALALLIRDLVTAEDHVAKMNAVLELAAAKSDQAKLALERLGSTAATALATTMSRLHDTVEAAAAATGEAAIEASRMAHALDTLKNPLGGTATLLDALKNSGMSTAEQIKIVKQELRAAFQQEGNENKIKVLNEVLEKLGVVAKKASAPLKETGEGITGVATDAEDTAKALKSMNDMLADLDFERSTAGMNDFEKAAAAVRKQFEEAAFDETGKRIVDVGTQSRLAAEGVEKLRDAMQKAAQTQFDKRLADLDIETKTAHMKGLNAEIEKETLKFLADQARLGAAALEDTDEKVRQLQEGIRGLREAQGQAQISDIFRDMDRAIRDAQPGVTELDRKLNALRDRFEDIKTSTGAVRDEFGRTLPEAEEQLRKLEETAKNVSLNIGKEISSGMSQVVTGILEGTRDGTDVLESFKDIGIGIIGKMIGGMIEEKLNFDIFFKKNFLEDLPGILSSFGGIAEGIFGSIFGSGGSLSGILSSFASGIGSLLGGGGGGLGGLIGNVLSGAAGGGGGAGGLLSGLASGGSGSVLGGALSAALGGNLATLIGNVGAVSSGSMGFAATIADAVAAAQAGVAFEGAAAAGTAASTSQGASLLTTGNLYALLPAVAAIVGAELQKSSSPQLRGVGTGLSNAAIPLSAKEFWGSFDPGKMDQTLEGLSKSLMRGGPAVEAIISAFDNQLSKGQMSRRFLGNEVLGGVPSIAGLGDTLNFDPYTSGVTSIEEAMKRFPELFAQAGGAAQAFGFALAGAVDSGQNDAKEVNYIVSTLIDNFAQAGLTGPQALTQIATAAQQLGFSVQEVAQFGMAQLQEQFATGQITLQQYVQGLASIEGLAGTVAANTGAVFNAFLSGGSMEAIRASFTELNALGLDTFGQLKEFIAEAFGEDSKDIIKAFEELGIDSMTSLADLSDEQLSSIQQKLAQTLGPEAKKIFEAFTNAGMDAMKAVEASGNEHLRKLASYMDGEFLRAAQHVFQALESSGIGNFTALSGASIGQLQQLDGALGQLGAAGRAVFEALKSNSIANMNELGAASRGQFKSIEDAIRRIPREVFIDIITREFKESSPRVHANLIERYSHLSEILTDIPDIIRTMKLREEGAPTFSAGTPYHFSGSDEMRSGRPPSRRVEAEQAARHRYEIDALNLQRATIVAIREQTSALRSPDFFGRQYGSIDRVARRTRGEPLVNKDRA